MAVGRDLSDQQLIRMLSVGDTIDDAVKFLYREYFYQLATYVEQNYGSRADAEDIFQEALLTFINLVKQQKFRGESTVKTFLYSINRNIWLNELKKRGRQEKRNKRFAEAGEANEPDVQQFISNREARNQVMNIIDGLGDVCKKILLAFYYENKSMQEILLELDYQNEQVVRNRKAKCMKSLTEKIKADGALAQSLKSALRYE